MRFLVAEVTAVAPVEPPEPLESLPSQRPKAPLNLALVIDASGSMAGEPIAAAKEAARLLAANLGADDRLSVVSFDSRVEVHVDGRRQDAAGRAAAAAADRPARGRIFDRPRRRLAAGLRLRGRGDGEAGGACRLRGPAQSRRGALGRPGEPRHPGARRACAACGGAARPRPPEHGGRHRRVVLRHPARGDRGERRRAAPPCHAAAGDRRARARRARRAAGDGGRELRSRGRHSHRLPCRAGRGLCAPARAPQGGRATG